MCPCVWVCTRQIQKALYVLRGKFVNFGVISYRNVDVDVSPSSGILHPILHLDSRAWLALVFAVRSLSALNPPAAAAAAATTTAAILGDAASDTRACARPKHGGELPLFRRTLGGQGVGRQKHGQFLSLLLLLLILFFLLLSLVLLLLLVLIDRVDASGAAPCRLLDPVRACACVRFRANPT